MKWKPYSRNELCRKLSGTTDWFLDGGHSLDFFLGESTRDHGDIDIGVFSPDTRDLLKHISDLGFQVFVATKGNLNEYNADSFLDSDHNFWVSDGDYFRFQILVYNLSSDRVYFRRNKNVSWPKRQFIIKKKDVRLVNPLITYAFKVTTSSVEKKDLDDISSLLNWMAKNA